MHSILFKRMQMCLSWRSARGYKETLSVVEWYGFCNIYCAFCNDIIVQHQLQYLERRVSSLSLIITSDSLKRRLVCVCLGSGGQEVPHCPAGPLLRCSWVLFYLGMTATRRREPALPSPTQTPSTRLQSAPPDPGSAAFLPGVEASWTSCVRDKHDLDRLISKWEGQLG